MQMTTFQLGVLALFGFLILAGVFVFAGYTPGGVGSVPAADLVMWGTYPETAVDNYLRDWNTANSSMAQVDYVRQDEELFEANLLQALATGKGPDLILLPSTLLVRQSDKLYPLSYQQFSARDYLDTFIDGASIFATKNGVYALPVAGDPLVMYWNKSLFSAANIAQPPQYWDEVITLAPKLTLKDSKGNITQSALALGGYRNISNAKDILATLFFQVGDPIALVAEKDDGLFSEIVLNKIGQSGLSPTESALRFFAQFGNAAETVYSWNRGLPNSREMFISGDLAVYFGRASEFDTLRRQNPNLSFDVSPMPTIRPAQNTPRNKNVAGELLGVAVLAATKYPAQSFGAAASISGPEWGAFLAESLGLSSLRRDSLKANPEDPYQTVFNQTTLTLRAWPDPSPEESDPVFRDMVESVLSGVSSVNALTTAYASLQRLAQ